MASERVLLELPSQQKRESETGRKLLIFCGNFFAVWIGYHDTKDDFITDTICAKML